MGKPLARLRGNGKDKLESAKSRLRAGERGGSALTQGGQKNARSEKSEAVA